MRDYKREELYPHTKVLSSTQVSDYEKNPAEFYAEWVATMTRTQSPAMLVGLAFSELYADRSFNHSEWLLERFVSVKMIDKLTQAITFFPKPYEPELELRPKLGAWTIRVTLDDYIRKSLTIIENKTGKIAWTQERVNYSDQLTIQAWAHWKLYGVVPRSIILNWVNLNSGGKLIHTFKTTRSLKAVKQYEQRILTIIKNIHAGNFSKALYD